MCSIPFIWILFVEILRNFGPLAFPWLDLSLTQSNYNIILQLASIHPNAISFVLLVFNGLIYQYLKSKEIRFFAYFSILLCIISIYGKSQIQHYKDTEPKDYINISIGQPVIFPDEKWVRDLRKRNFEIME